MSIFWECTRSPSLKTCLSSSRYSSLPSSQSKRAKMSNLEETTSSKKDFSYIPRKCSWTHKMLPATERGSVQINVGKLDKESGQYLQGEFDTFCFSSKVRSDAHSDKALAKLAYKKGLIWVRC